MDKTAVGYQEEGVIKLLKDVRDGPNNDDNDDDNNDDNDDDNNDDKIEEEKNVLIYLI